MNAPYEFPMTISQSVEMTAWAWESVTEADKQRMKINLRNAARRLQMNVYAPKMEFKAQLGGVVQTGIYELPLTEEQLDTLFEEAQITV